MEPGEMANAREQVATMEGAAGRRGVLDGGSNTTEGEDLK
ncbi:MAG: hypothetical protein Aurels2KO_58460 [Aureliella sp.]